jgi:DNA-binding Lrp family transcriptional regulator
MKLDRYDLAILRILARDGRITKSRLAEEINLSISPAWERVKRLEEAGVIRGYRAIPRTTCGASRSALPRPRRSCNVTRQAVASTM